MWQWTWRGFQLGWGVFRSRFGRHKFLCYRAGGFRWASGWSAIWIVLHSQPLAPSDDKKASAVSQSEAHRRSVRKSWARTSIIALITYTTASQTASAGRKEIYGGKKEMLKKKNALRGADEERNGELAKKVIKLLTSAECSSVFSRPHDGQVHWFMYSQVAFGAEWISLCIPTWISKDIFLGLKITFLSDYTGKKE